MVKTRVSKPSAVISGTSVRDFLCWPNVHSRKAKARGPEAPRDWELWLRLVT